MDSDLMWWVWLMVYSLVGGGVLAGLWSWYKARNETKSNHHPQ